MSEMLNQYGEFDMSLCMCMQGVNLYAFHREFFCLFISKYDQFLMKIKDNEQLDERKNSKTV